MEDRQFQFIKNQVRNAIISAYAQVSDFSDFDLASILMNDYVSKTAIGTEEARVKHIEINPYSENVRDVAKYREDESKRFGWDYATITESIDKIKSDIYVEMIPSKSINQKTTFLDALKLTYKALGVNVDVHKDYLDPIDVDVNKEYADSVNKAVSNLNIDPLSTGSISSGISMRNKDRLHFEYDKVDGKSIGFVTIAESEKNKDEFHYPRFKDYVAPTLLFNLFGDGSEYHFDILEKLNSQI